MRVITTFLENQFARLAEGICRFPGQIVVVSLVLVILAGAGASQLGVVNNPNDLISQDSKVLRYFLNYLKEFQTRDPIMIVIRSDQLETNKKVADTLAKRIASRPDEIQKIFYRNDFSKMMAGMIQRSDLLTKMRPYLLHYEETGKLKAILEQLQSQKDLLIKDDEDGVNLNSLLEEAIEKFETLAEKKGKGGSLENLDVFADRMIADLEKLAKELNTPVSAEKNEKKGVSFEKELDEEIHQKIQSEISGISPVEYIAFEEGKMVLMVLTPGKGNGSSFAPYDQTIKNLRKDIEVVKSEFEGVEIGLTGEPVLLDDELKQSDRDMFFAAPLAFTLIAILFFLIYREVVKPVLALTALVFALVWSLGFTWVAVGHFNIISQAFILMLMGLGIDFGIQIIGRYEEERAARRGSGGKKGKDEDGEEDVKVVRATLQHTGIAVLTGGLITATAFFTMCFNEFLGLAELGIISGSGILFCLVANLVLLPALLIWVRRKRKTNQGSEKTQDKTKKRDQDEDKDKNREERKRLFQEKVDRILFSQPRLVLVLAVLVSLGAAFCIQNVRFDYNLLNLQNPEMPSVKLVHELLDSQADSFIFGVVIAEDMEDAKVKSAQLEKLPSVAGVNSPVRVLAEIAKELPKALPELKSQFLPQNQKEKLPILKQIKKVADQLKFKADTTSELDLDDAIDDLETLLEYSSEGKEEAKKFRNVKDKRAKQAFKLFDRLIPALENSLTRLKSLNEKEAQQRLQRYQSQLFDRMNQEFAFLRKLKLDQRVPEGLLNEVDFKVDEIPLEELPDELRNHYVSPNGRILLEVVPKENVWEREAGERFVKDIRTVSEEATGTPVQSYVYIKTLKDSYVQAAGLAFVAIIILIFIHFKKLQYVVLAILPLVLGILWTLGCMGILGIPFNPANIITLPLVIGIGVAFGVYVIDRYREEGEMKLFRSSTGKAILLSALTTMIGFGAMMTGDYRGLVSLGLLMSMGILFCFLASALVMPQFLVLMKKEKKLINESEN